MKGDLVIDEPSGDRWQLALDLIENGEAAVSLAGDTQIRRSAGWPGADGHIYVGVVVDGDTVSKQAAQSRVDEARRRVDDLAKADPRFAALVRTHGVIWELVADYGSGSVQLAGISETGKIHWPKNLPSDSN